MAGRHETIWAVVLRSEDTGEADRVYELYTEKGTRWVRARGTRRIGSRLAGALDRFNLVEVTLYRQGAVATVIGALAHESWPGLKSRLEALAAVTLLAELVERLSLDGEMFPWFITVLRAFEVADSEPLPILLTNGRALLMALGWAPGGRVCPACARPLTAGARLLPSGVLVHPACGTGGVLVSSGIRSWFADGQLDPRLAGEAFAVLERLFEGHLEAPLRSVAFARSLLVG